MTLMYKVRVIIAHPPYTFAEDQHDPLLEELPFTLEARNTQEVHDHILDEANRTGVTIKKIHIEHKQETR